jgi:hypothetical protein
MEQSIQAYSLEKLSGLERQLVSLESDLDEMLKKPVSRARLTKSS